MGGENTDVGVQKQQRNWPPKNADGDPEFPADLKSVKNVMHTHWKNKHSKENPDLPKIKRPFFFLPQGGVYK